MIFCVEDDSGIRDLMIYTLSASGFKAVGFSRAEEFWKEMKNVKPELVLQNKNMKEIQEWMGHANIATTADTYSHIAFEQKIECGNCIQEALGF